MFTIEQIQAVLDKVFIECGYKVGDAPLGGGDWRGLEQRQIWFLNVVKSYILIDMCTTSETC